jgi:hypothetical protein
VTPIASGDPWLRRFEKDIVLACLSMAAASLVLRKWNPDVALGVLGGGTLAAFSYWAIKGGVDALLASAVVTPVPDPTATPVSAEGVAGVVTAEAAPGTDEQRPGGRLLHARALDIVKFIGRYALLAVAAYGMLTRLRLHPVGMLVGVSAPVVAAAVLVVRIAARRL